VTQPEIDPRSRAIGPSPPTSIDCAPPRRLGLALGSLFLLLLLGLSIFSILQLASAAISPLLILWVCLPLIALPLAVLVAVRLYGLLSAHYHLDRNGFSMRWGFSSEQMPLSAIHAVRVGTDLPAPLPPRGLLAWPGLVIGRQRVEGFGEVEFFASSSQVTRIVFISTADKQFAISPPDADAFRQSFVEAARLGALQPLPESSRRPDFLFSRIWSNAASRLLLLVGLALPLALLTFLAVRAPHLPPSVPFGFDPAGLPSPFAPPGRLLLLPFIGGFCWSANAILGALLYRSEENRFVSFGLWAISILVGALLWGAAFHLLAAA
jgi:hypothetical protein